MEVIIKSIIDLVQHNTSYCAFLIVFIATCIEIVPIKINPLSSLLHWAGDRINGNIKTQLGEISEQLNQVSDRVDKMEINDMRSTILDFANSCMNERKHTQEEFDHVIDLYQTYETIIKEKDLKNGKVDLAYNYIKELYTKSLQENSFLKWGDKNG